MKAEQQVAETIAASESLSVETCRVLLVLISLESAADRAPGWGVPITAVIQTANIPTSRPSLALLELLIHNLISSQYVGQDLRVAVTTHGYDVVSAAANALSAQAEP